MRQLFLTMVCSATAAALMSAPAQAEITVTQAEYAAGILRIVGTTSKANQKVTLDRRYETQSGKAGQLRFRIRYLPRACTATLRAGRDERPVVIANCEPVGVKGVGQPRSKDAPTPKPRPAPGAPPQSPGG